jgi:F-type H+-transporting ATPase subunit b
MPKTRRTALLVAVVLGLGAFLFSSAPAGAAGGELDHAVEECIHELEEANSIDVDCQEAPNPILPETNEIIWGAFGFFVVFAFLFWKGTPAIKKTMNDRTEKIRGDIEGAEAAKAEADKVLAEYHSQLADARNEAARILEEARQDADAVKAERIAAIQPEIDEMRTRAASEIESSKAQALSELRGEITAIALGAAERVVERNLDDATNRALIDSYIDSVGAQS